jgi:methyl-accepting chemotaxis protein/sigma-B regulation protein RsbU (phosphoserine phosphatase)
MQKIIKKIFSAPSIRFNLLVVIEIVTLLMASLGGLFYFTRQALVEESKVDAELRLEGTIQHVDNMLLSIEQSTGNMYHALLEHIDQPDRMQTFCRKLVECNPNIDCRVIAFKPNYFPGQEQFFTFVHRKKSNSPELITSNESPNMPYTQKKWYIETMEKCRPSWIDPGENRDYNLEPVITYCQPIIDYSGECVGVMAAGMSIGLLSQIVLEAKRSPNSYSILLAHDGTYLIHPNRERLVGQTVFEEPEITENPTALAAAKAMVEGKTGDMSFQMNDFTWYLFYKPFVLTKTPSRSIEEINWSIATIYPKEDIFGEYNHLVFHVLGIVAIALLVFYMFCKKAIRKQVKPLAYLIESSERIANGHYDESIPNLKRDDEIGEFYKHFQLMQKALATEIARLEEQAAMLNNHHEELQKMNQQIQNDEEVETTFLHNVTNNMIAPAKSIEDSVKALCDQYEDITLTKANKEKDNIKLQSETILELLSHKFNFSPEENKGKMKEERKEESHE